MSDTEKNQLSLDSLIGDLSGVSNHIELTDPKKCEEALIELEIINAICFDRNRKPNEEDAKDIERYVATVESIFENSRHLFFPD